MALLSSSNPGRISRGGSFTPVIDPNASIKTDKNARGLFIDTINVDPGDSLSPEDQKTLDDFNWEARIEAENASRHKVTANGNAQLDGNGNCVFGGVNGSYLDIPSSVDFDNDVDCTIEMYVYNRVNRDNDAPGAPGSALQIGRMGPAGGLDIRMAFGTDSNGNISYYWYDGSTNFIRGTATVPLNTWTHIALSINATTARLFIDGVMDVKGTVTNLIPNDLQLILGQSQDDTDIDSYSGDLSRVIYSKGIGRYGADTSFTPPARTDEIADDEYTVLALDFAGTAASQRIIDLAKPENGGGVPIIPDISGNEIDAEQSVVVSQSIFDPSNTSLTPDGGDDFYSMDQDSFNDQDFTIFVVARWDSTPSGNGPYTLTNQNEYAYGGWRLGIDATNRKIKFNTSENNGNNQHELLSIDAYNTDSDYHVVTIRKEQGGDLQMWVDSTLQQTIPSSVDVAYTGMLNGTDIFYPQISRWGVLQSPNRYSDSPWNGILYRNVVIPDSDRAEIEQLLIEKYGV